MKYDLIVVGGGPAGLMAARTASEDGLKVLLIERKKDITENNRTDVAIFYWKFLVPDSYIEPIMVEIGTGKTLVDIGAGRPGVRFRYLVPGFSFDYHGPVLPYYNFINISPVGYQVYSLKDELWGFHYSKEVVLADLLASVEKAGAEVLTGTLALGAENTPGGARLRVQTKTGERTLEAKRVIAADGVDSTIVESLGLNKDRQQLPATEIVGYILEGVEVEASIPGGSSWLSFLIPSISRGGILLGLHAEGGNTNLKHLLGQASALEEFMKHSRYAPWFRNARLVRKTGVHMAQRTPTLLKEVAAGNILIIGDAISNESWIQGAIACGYQGAKATLKELNGQKGYAEYIEWLEKAFAFWAYPQHFRLKTMHNLLKMVCSDEEIDFIFRILQGRVEHPPFVIAENPEIVRAERPALYERLKKAIEYINRVTAKGWTARVSMAPEG
jgi:flavin-dependent dehydrogenase